MFASLHNVSLCITIIKVGSGVNSNAKCGILCSYYTLVTSFPSFITSNNVSLPLIRAFMDDINLMSSSVSDTRSLLDRCGTALKWAGMEFVMIKVMIKGKSLNCTPFYVSKSPDSTDITSIHSSPVKFLGRIIDGSISDRKSIDELEQKLLEGFKVNKS